MNEADLQNVVSNFMDKLLSLQLKVPPSAGEYLLELLSEQKRKTEIISKVTNGEKTLEDLIEGSTKLAETTVKIVREKNEYVVERNDVENAVKQLRCQVWPFCD